jgi:bud site selection protein 31
MYYTYHLRDPPETLCLFGLFYEQKSITRELYEYSIKEAYADKKLMAKWKKQGNENLCFLRCIQTLDTNFGAHCWNGQVHILWLPGPPG